MTERLRRLAISQQGINVPHSTHSDIGATLKIIEHLGYVQIDTLSVVERAHHHVLWSRLPSYKTSHLNQLVSDKKVFEYWFHAASYLPMRDYRFALPQMDVARKGELPYFAGSDKKLMNHIVKRIEGEGPLKARDIDNGVKSNGKSWSTRPVRRALDQLYMEGKLMICARNGMEKVYDVAQRCLPSDIDLSMPSQHEFAEYLFDTTLRAHGVFTFKQLTHLRRGNKLREAMRDVVDANISNGRISKVSLDNKHIVYASSRAIDSAADNNVDEDKSGVKILSPFDNVLIHRDRLQILFDFDYKIECYVSAQKRVFGYLCLPILYKGKFVGRIDCKAHRAHRAHKRFEVLSFHVEPGIKDYKRFRVELMLELQAFANFNQCPLLETSVLRF